MIVMSIGLMFGRKPITGSCGGLKAFENEIECELCGGDLKNQDLSRIPLRCLDSLKHIFSFGKDRKKIIEKKMFLMIISF